MAAAPIALCQRRSDEVLLVLFCDAELQKGGKLKFVIVRSITFSHLINYLLTIILHAIVSQINKVSAGCDLSCDVSHTNLTSQSFVHG